MKPWSIIALAITLVASSAQSQTVTSAKLTCYNDNPAGPKLLKSTERIDGIISHAMGVTPAFAHQFYALAFDAGNLDIRLRCNGEVAQTILAFQGLTGRGGTGTIPQYVTGMSFADWGSTVASGQGWCRYTIKPKNGSGDCEANGLLDLVPCSLELKFAGPFKPKGICPN